MNTISGLKLNSRIIIKEKLKAALIGTLLFMIFSYILSVLMMQLSGYSAVITRYTNELTKLIEENPMAIYETDPTALMESIVWPKISPVAVILMIAIAVMHFVLDAGYKNYCLMLLRREEVKIRNLFDGFNHVWKIIVISLVRTVLTALGSAFFVIPGLVIAYQYRMAIYIMFDDPELGPIKCLKASRILMRGRKLELFILEISFIGWLFLNEVIAMFAIIPVLEIWLKPYMGITVAGFYNDILAMTLKKEQQTQSSDNDHVNTGE